MMLSGMSENDRLSSSSRGALEAKTLKHAALDNISKAMNVLCPEYRHVGHSNAAATAVSSFRSQSVLLGQHRFWTPSLIVGSSSRAAVSFGMPWPWQPAN
jgi:hypothetical protein